MIDIEYLLVLTVLIAAGCVGLARWAFLHLAFLDRPGSEAHKLQTDAVPYGGGAGMGLAFAACLSLAWWSEPGVIDADSRRACVAGVLGAGVLFVLGLIDDRKPLRAGLKFFIQSVVCALAVWQGHLGLDSLHTVPWLANTIAWCWLIIVANAYNLLDHADGLSGSVALVSVGMLLIGSISSDDPHQAQLWIVLLGCLAGFLFWNLPPARIYMGDAGALPLGYLIGVGTLSVTFWPSDEGGSPLAVLSPLFITAIPIFDTAVVVLKRLRRGQPIMVGDRNHISHRLRRLGMSPYSSLGTVIALQIALAAGTLQLRSQEWTPGLVVVAQSVAILLAVVLLETSRDDQA